MILIGKLENVRKDYKPLKEDNYVLGKLKEKAENERRVYFSDRPPSCPSVRVQGYEVCVNEDGRVSDVTLLLSLIHI